MVYYCNFKRLTFNWNETIKFYVRLVYHWLLKPKEIKMDRVLKGILKNELTIQFYDRILLLSYCQFKQISLYKWLMVGGSVRYEFSLIMY